MSFVKNNINAPDLEQEIIYHLGEIQYHEKKYREALQEVVHHEERIYTHQTRIIELTEVSHV